MTTGAVVAVDSAGNRESEECTDAPPSANPLSGLSKLLGNRPADECPPGDKPTIATPEVAEQGAKQEDPAPDVTTQVATVDVTIETVATRRAQLGDTIQDVATIMTPRGRAPNHGNRDLQLLA